MSWLSQYSFVYPWVLPLLVLPPLVWYFLYWRKDRHSSLRLPTTSGLQGVSSWRSQVRPYLPLLRVLSLCAFLIALARPRLDLKEESVKAEGIDIVLSMDLSTSMGATDFPPNRLEAAKNVAIEFVQSRQYDRIGLVVYAAEAYTKAPLTVDHDLIIQHLQGLEMGELLDGTAIGTGLATAVNRLKESTAKSRIIILLTDGENNAGYQSPELAAELAKEFGIRVYTIGVGSGEETLMPSAPIGQGRYRYRPTQGSVDENLLQYIADLTSGRYFRAKDKEELASIYGYIDELEKTEIETSVFRRYQEEFGRFMLWGMVLLSLEILLRYTLLRSIP